MGFVGAIKSGFKNYANTNGRAARSEFWYWELFAFISGLIPGVLDLVFFKHIHIGPYGPATFLWSLFLFLPGFSVFMRRLHDVNRSGYWWLINFTIVGVIPLLIWSCSKGTTGDNRFGPDPLANH